jgi:hypothetical protein
MKMIPLQVSNVYLSRNSRHIFVYKYRYVYVYVNDPYPYISTYCYEEDNNHRYFFTPPLYPPLYPFMIHLYLPLYPPIFSFMAIHTLFIPPLPSFMIYLYPFSTPLYTPLNPYLISYLNSDLSPMQGWQSSWIWGKGAINLKEILRQISPHLLTPLVHTLLTP